MTNEANPGERPVERVEALTAKLGAALASHATAPDGTAMWIVPEAWDAVKVPPIDPPLPDSARVAVKLTSAAAFVGYVNHFARPETTRLFADMEGRRLVGILDYHIGTDEPRRCAHLAVYPAPFSPEWQRWQAIDGRSLTQEEFLEFVEENAPDIAEPAAADILELAANFRQVRTEHFARSTRLRDGSISLTFRDEDGGGENAASLPPHLVLSVPILEGGERFRVKAWIRTRTANGALRFIVALHRRDLVEREVFGEAVDGIGRETGIEVWRGRVHGLSVPA